MANPTPVAPLPVAALPGIGSTTLALTSKRQRRRHEKSFPSPRKLKLLNPERSLAIKNAAKNLESALAAAVADGARARFQALDEE